jgi:methylglutaconyl-CoA hydratase
MELPKPMGSLTQQLTIQSQQCNSVIRQVILSKEIVRLLSEELNQLSGNADVSVIVLRSEGTGAFCAGASLTNFCSI